MDINNILNQFADDVTEIDISYKSIEGTLNFTRFTKLVKLKCNNSQITSLDNIPHSLIELDCSINKIISLDNLPNSLTRLYCYNNKITSLDNLPDSLIVLQCCYNKITSLDKLPNSLTRLYCDNTVKNYNELMIKYNKKIIN